MKQIILMSIRPEWVAKILNGEKTVEIRKTALHEGDEVHIYCTKSRPWLYFGEFRGHYQLDYSAGKWGDEINGNVVAKFIVGKVEKIKDKGEAIWIAFVGKENKCYFDNRTLFTEKLRKETCLTEGEMAWYGKDNNLYALSITQLEIFDKPRALGEYKKPVEDYSLGVTGGFAKLVSITHAPQSYMRAWVE